MPFEVEISPKDTTRFRSVLPADRFEEFERVSEEVRELLDGHVVWNINSTAQGGGVVELLQSLVAYARGVGVDARWMVLEGPPEFFALTKRIHNRLHGAEGDGGPLGDAERNLYESVCAENAAGLADRVQSGDVVVIHDPQPAGLAKPLREMGASVIWRCHVGIDMPNELARGAWEFLIPYVSPAQLYVFSRESFAWEGLDRDRIVVIAPSIDVFTPKNVDIDPDTVLKVLYKIGVLENGPDLGPVTFERQDGTPGRVEHCAQLFEDGRLRPDMPVVVQVSRWDALKDPLGVIRGFAGQVPAETGAHLVYAGPSVEAVVDDPEGERILRDAIALRESLPEEPRGRVHLASMPMVDIEENAFMINALQRHARVIVQKSLAEGFGLTVAEGMWKARPLVASRIGGIQDQVVHGESGILLDDPRDLAAYGAAVTDLLSHPERAERLGQFARERVRDRFVSVRSLLDYAAAVRKLATGIAA
jgi:trehalose synthase